MSEHWPDRLSQKAHFRYMDNGPAGALVITLDERDQALRERDEAKQKVANLEQIILHRNAALVQTERERDEAQAKVHELELRRDLTREGLESLQGHVNELVQQRDEARAIVLEIFPGAKRLGGYWDDLEEKHLWLRERHNDEEPVR